MRSIILPSLVVLAIVGAIILFGSSPKKAETSSQTGQPTTQSVAYFDDNAKVMYFYSEYCHVCQEEKKVLTELGNEGYKVKPMNVGDDPVLAEKYNIKGTPTFISSDGTILYGYADKEKLKEFLDKYK